MRAFVASKKFSALTFLLLAAVATASYFFLKPTGADISNSEIIRIFTLIGWFTGLAITVLSLILFGVLKLLQKIFGLSASLMASALVLLLSILPWLIFSWVLLGEPRYTNIAKAIIDFIARPMLWGSLAASLFVVIFGLIAILSPQKK